MFKSSLAIRFAFMVAFSVVLSVSAAEEKALRALLVTGGCCHDYNRQKVIIPEGVSQRANVEWTVVQEGGNSTKHRVSIYEKADWAADYDVVVHNECFADVADAAFIENVLKPHREEIAEILDQAIEPALQNPYSSAFRL